MEKNSNENMKLLNNFDRNMFGDNVRIIMKMKKMISIKEYSWERYIIH